MDDSDRLALITYFDEMPGFCGVPFASAERHEFSEYCASWEIGDAWALPSADKRTGDLGL